MVNDHVAKSVADEIDVDWVYVILWSLLIDSV